MSAWSIAGARHGGITVSDLDRSLEFYCGVIGLELRWRKVFDEGVVTRIVGIPEAEAVEVAVLGIPGSDVEVELLEYHGCERTPGAAEPSSPGTGHFCVFVDGIEELYADLASRGVSFRSDGPVEMRNGPNAGGKSLYSLDPDGYIFEFHQRPPR